MTYYFSPTNNSFYPAKLKPRYEAAGTWPSDAVEVDEAIYEEFGAGNPPELHRRGVDENGMPKWEPIPPDSSMPRYFDVDAGEIVDNPNYTPPPYTVATSTIVRRLRDAGKLSEAIALLEAPENKELLYLWNSISEVESDHPETQMLRDLLGTIDGLDVDAILAREE